MTTPATEVETLLMALYTARWDEPEMAEWAAAYITAQRDRSRITFGRLTVLQLPIGQWAIYDLDAVSEVEARP